MERCKSARAARRRAGVRRVEWFLPGRLRRPQQSPVAASVPWRSATALLQYTRAAQPRASAHGYGDRCRLPFKFGKEISRHSLSKVENSRLWVFPRKRHFEDHCVSPVCECLDTQKPIIIYDPYPIRKRKWCGQEDSNLHWSPN